RIGPAAHALAHHLLNPREWIVVLVVLAAVACGLVLERRPAWLVPLALLGTLYALLVWVYWASSADEGYIEGFVVSTSAYRTVDPLVLVAAVLVPVLGERLARLAPARV